MATLSTYDKKFAFESRDITRTLEAFKQATGGLLDVFQLEQWRVPAGGGVEWQLGDNSVKELTGVIMHHHPARVFWATPYGSGTAQAPDCSSQDGLVGYGSPGGVCAKCPLAQFTETSAPACKQQYRALVLPADSVLPAQLTIPTMSVSIVRDYLKQLVFDYGAFAHNVVTSFTLRRVKNAGGINYAQLVCKPIGFVSKDLHAKVQAYADQLRSVTAAAAVEAAKVRQQLSELSAAESGNKAAPAVRFEPAEPSTVMGVDDIPEPEHEHGVPPGVANG